MREGWLLLVVGCAACGRIGFDPRDSAGRDSAGNVSDGAPFSAGLLHYWPLDEAPGTMAAVDVIAAANGTLSGTASFAAGHRAGALASGQGGFAFVTTTPADMLGRDQLTVSAWIRRAGPNQIEQVGQELMPGQDEISIQAWSDGLVYFCVGTPGVCGTTPAGNDARWHLATLVFDGARPTDATRLAGFIDGARQTLSWAYTLPVPTSTPMVTAHFDLGAVSDNEGADSGTIDDVRIYDHPLADADVLALYSGT